MQRLKTPKVVMVGVLLLSGCGAGGAAYAIAFNLERRLRGLQAIEFAGRGLVL